MSTLELKAEIHKKIDALDNVSELIDINVSLDWFMEENLKNKEQTRLETLNHENDEKGNAI